METVAPGRPALGRLPLPAGAAASCCIAAMAFWMPFRPAGTGCASPWCVLMCENLFWVSGRRGELPIPFAVALKKSSCLVALRCGACSRNPTPPPRASRARRQRHPAASSVWLAWSVARHSFPDASTDSSANQTLCNRILARPCGGCRPRLAGGVATLAHRLALKAPARALAALARCQPGPGQCTRHQLGQCRTPPPGHPFHAAPVQRVKLLAVFGFLKRCCICSPLRESPCYHPASAHSRARGANRATGSNAKKRI